MSHIQTLEQNFLQFSLQDDKAAAIWACLNNSGQQQSPQQVQVEQQTYQHSETFSSSFTTTGNDLNSIATTLTTATPNKNNASQKKAPKVRKQNEHFKAGGVAISKEVLCNLASRFILNMPNDEINDPIRICFQIELAFWYYTDVILPKAELQLPALKLKTFAFIMFNYIESLKKFLPTFDNVIGQWMEYKFNIPTYGCILLDSSLEYVLLVQGFGSKTWGYPKGKQNHSENPIFCASREVEEEIGYNCLPKMRENDYLERKVMNSLCRLYVITDVKMDYPFRPHVNNEIRDIQWFKVNELPTPKAPNVANENFANKFYSVSPFVFSLRKWIKREKTRREVAAQGNMKPTKILRSRYNSTGDSVLMKNSSDDSGTNSPYHLVENGPDVIVNDQVNALFAACSARELEKSMHTKNVYHADNVQQESAGVVSYLHASSVVCNNNFNNNSSNQELSAERKNWPDMWQELVNRYNHEHSDSQGEKIDYDLKSNHSASVSSLAGGAPLFSALGIGRQNVSTPINNSFSTKQPMSCNDKLNFLFNIASGGQDSMQQQQLTSSPIHASRVNNDSLRKLFSPMPSMPQQQQQQQQSPQTTSSSSMRPASCASVVSEKTIADSYRGISYNDAQTLSEPMARFFNLLASKQQSG